MAMWGTRILSAFLAFTLGVYSTGIVRYVVAAADKVGTVYAAGKSQMLPLLKLNVEGHQSSDDAADVMQPHPVSLSPYEIKRILENDELSPCQRGEYSGFVDFGPIWEKLQLKISDTIDPFPERCSSPATANIYSLELDGNSGKETLLRLDFGEPYASLYLVFKYRNRQQNRGWNILGSLAYYYGAPFIPPSHRVVSEGRHRWLAVEYQTGHGSAFGSGAEDWYEVGESSVIRVLTYPTGVYWGMSDPTIGSDTKVLKIEDRNGVVTAFLQSWTSYGYYESFDDKFVRLWTNQRKATYIKGPGMQEFIFDSLYSEMAEEEFDSPNDQDPISNKNFLKYNYRELAKIATKGNRKQKDWLRDFLAHRDDSLERQSLQSALKGSRP